MGTFLISLGHDFVLRKTDAAAGTPGHDIVPLVDPAAIMARLEKVPDRVVVLVGHRVVGVVPVHPLTKPYRLLDLAGGVFPDPFLASLDEVGDAEVFNLSLVLEP